MVFPSVTGSNFNWPLPQVSNLPFMASSQQLLRVHGLEGAKAYPMTGPNCTVALFDSDDDIMYIKSTDSANVVSIRTFTFTEMIEPAKADLKYVTVEEFNKFKEELLNGKQSVRRSKSAKRSTESDDEPIDE